jgi:hypothetical protein
MSSEELEEFVELIYDEFDYMKYLAHSDGFASPCTALHGQVNMAGVRAMMVGNGLDFPTERVEWVRFMDVHFDVVDGPDGTEPYFKLARRLV